MSKLLRIDRKLRTLGRRLTTDANGAPCCCQTSNQCPCNPALPLAPFPYVTCVGGRYASSPGAYPYVGQSSPARIAVVRVQWQGLTNKADRIASTNSTVYSVERSDGAAQWCVVRTGLQWSTSQWLLNNASSAYEYQRVGSRIEPINVAENYEGADALVVLRPGASVDRRFRIQIVQTSTIRGAFANGIAVEAYPVQTDVTNSVGDPIACTVDASQTITRSTYTETIRRTFQFASNATQAAYTERASDNSTYADGSFNRYDATASVVWTVRYLTCTTGGDPTGSLIEEPGCSNCFDPSKLEPM